jgi:hypothetical protein
MGRDMTLILNETDHKNMETRGRARNHTDRIGSECAITRFYRHMKFVI